MLTRLLQRDLIGFGAPCAFRSCLEISLCRGEEVVLRMLDIEACAGTFDITFGQAKGVVGIVSGCTEKSLDTVTRLAYDSVEVRMYALLCIE